MSRFSAVRIKATFLNSFTIYDSRSGRCGYYIFIPIRAQLDSLFWLLYIVTRQRVCPTILNISCIMHVDDQKPLFRAERVVFGRPHT